MKAISIAAAGLCAMLCHSAVAESLGEHPAVIVKRHAAVQPAKPATENFYMHPAHFDWFTEAPADTMVVEKNEVGARKFAAAQRPISTY